jgi:hypothetical protein
MKLITTNNYQCVPAAFAMVMGTTVEELLTRLGHDGKEVVAEDVPLPEGWRSFHPEEFVDLLLEDGYSATMISIAPMMIHGPKLINHAAYIGQGRFFEALLYGNGVIFGQLDDGGRGHAVAWNRSEVKLYDPRGKISEWEDIDLKPLQFYLIQEIKR